MKVQAVENGVVIHVRVKPGSKRFSIKDSGSRMLVELRSPPVGGQANEELVRELSGLFGRPVQILKGQKSRQKAVLIRGAAPAEAESRLAEIESLL